MGSTTDFRNGLTIVYNNQLFTIVEFQHVKPGKGPAFVRTKLKSVTTGKVIDNTFRAGEKVETVRLTNKKMQYLYQDSTGYTFMDLETYDQVTIPEDLLEDKIKLLKESETCDVLYHGDSPLGVELPIHVELAVVETEPGEKGNTAQGGSKPAVMETGATIQVPFFVNQGEVLKIDTRTGEYVERVKK